MPPLNNIKVHIADLAIREHIDAFVKLTTCYIQDEMGGGTPWTRKRKEKVICDLQGHPSCRIFLASSNGEFAGISTCFLGYSTFLAKGLINIHDFFILKSHRGLGIGRILMDYITNYAVQNNLGKITLEVREDNPIAQGLYKKSGFQPLDPEMLFWAKYI